MANINCNDIGRWMHCSLSPPSSPSHFHHHHDAGASFIRRLSNIGSIMNSKQVREMNRERGRLNNLSINKHKSRLAQPFRLFAPSIAISRCCTLFYFHSNSIERCSELRRSVGAIYVFIISLLSFKRSSIDSRCCWRRNSSGPLTTRAPRFSLLLPATFYLIFIYISHRIASNP